MITINELYHSDTYLGADYSDGLKHFKYVKRYKVGDKWRYVYADQTTHTYIKSQERGYKYNTSEAKTYENLAEQNRKKAIKTKKQSDRDNWTLALSENRKYKEQASINKKNAEAKISENTLKKALSQVKKDTRNKGKNALSKNRGKTIHL